MHSKCPLSIGQKYKSKCIVTNFSSGLSTAEVFGTANGQNIRIFYISTKVKTLKFRNNYFIKFFLKF